MERQIIKTKIKSEVSKIHLAAKESLNGVIESPNGELYLHVQGGFKKSAISRSKDVAVDDVELDEGSKIVSHSHENIEIITIYEGLLSIKIGQFETILNVGESAKIPSGWEHSGVALKYTRYINVFVPGIGADAMNELKNA